MVSKKEIQQFVDEVTGDRPEAFREFLDALAESAHATEQHVDENWQDRTVAQAWGKIASVIEAASKRVEDLEPFDRGNPGGECSECGGKKGKHQDDCEFSDDVECEDCGETGGGHADACTWSRE